MEIRKFLVLFKCFDAHTQPFRISTTQIPVAAEMHIAFREKNSCLFLNYSYANASSSPDRVAALRAYKTTMNILSYVSRAHFFHRCHCQRKNKPTSISNMHEFILAWRILARNINNNILYYTLLFMLHRLHNIKRVRANSIASIKTTTTTKTEVMHSKG